MAYTIKDHGYWSAYTPDPVPEWVQDVPGGRVLFVRQGSNGPDWYEYRKTGFAAGTLVAMAFLENRTGQEVIMGVYPDRDNMAVPPPGTHVLEISGTDPADPKPWAQFEQRIYDPKAKAIGDVWKAPLLSVAASQAKIQLSRMPHDGSVVPGAANLFEATKKLVEGSGDFELQLWFTEARAWKVDSPNVQKIGAAFKLSPEEIKAAFDAASKIEE